VIAGAISAVQLSSSPSLVTSNITFRRCEFTALTNAFNSSANTKGILVTESTFDLLYQGIVLADPGSVNPGSTGFRILGNSFDRIHQEGILTQANQQLVASGYNIFYDVANGLSTPINPVTPVIDFLDSNNVSIGDLFQRTDAQALIRARIRIGSQSNIVVTNGKKIQMGTYTRESGASAALTAGASNVTLFTVSSSSIPAFIMEYTIVRDSAIKTGTLTVVASTDGSGGDLVDNDNSFENTDPEFILSVSETGGIITVSYTDNDALLPVGNIKYSLTYLA
jgi:hypothetical protein